MMKKCCGVEIVSLLLQKVRKEANHVVLASFFVFVNEFGTRDLSLCPIIGTFFLILMVQCILRLCMRACCRLRFHRLVQFVCHRQCDRIRI